MDNLFKIFPDVMPIFILLSIGYAMKKTKFLSSSTINEINNLLLNILLPILLFKSFLEMEFKFEYLNIILLIYAVNILIFMLAKLLNKVLAINNPYFPLLFTGFAAGAMGIPLFGIVYGIDNIGIFGTIQLGQELYVWTMIFPSLLVLKTGSRNIKRLVISFVKNPILIGIVTGVTLNLAGMQPLFSKNIFLSGIKNTIDLVSPTMLPLILITIGYKVNFDFDELYLPLKTLILRFTVLSSVALLISHFIFNQMLELNYLFQVAVLVLFILPPPFMISLFVSEKEEENQAYVDSTISLSILCSLGLFMVISLFYT
ncbi:auxin efflux carrier [Halanaerocella petrolearia]